jgi:lipid IVA palmitoyltransferase
MIKIQNVHKAMSFTVCFLISVAVCADNSKAYCKNWFFLFKTPCKRFNQIWYEGNYDFYFTGFAWHNRYAYDKERVLSFNELAWGGGFGKGFYDEDGDWHGLYTLGFSDSHKNLEPVVGYAFLKVAQLHKNLRIGGGYTLLVTARKDMWKNRPFPGMLPWFSLNYKQASLLATYIPGSFGAGNVLFLMGKWTLS